MTSIKQCLPIPIRSNHIIYNFVSPNPINMNNKLSYILLAPSISIITETTYWRERLLVNVYSNPMIHLFRYSGWIKVRYGNCHSST